MTKSITAEELRAILAAVPDDQTIYLGNTDESGISVKSYSLHRFADGAVELTLFSDEQCGLDI